MPMPMPSVPPDDGRGPTVYATPGRAYAGVNGDEGEVEFRPSGGVSDVATKVSVQRCAISSPLSVGPGWRWSSRSVVSSPDKGSRRLAGLRIANPRQRRMQPALRDPRSAHHSSGLGDDLVDLGSEKLLLPFASPTKQGEFLDQNLVSAAQFAALVHRRCHHVAGSDR